jgi:long-subunit fatty acid transport protein
MTIRTSSSRCACLFSSSSEAEIHCFCILIVGLLLSLGSPPRLEAAFHEQMGLDTKAISLANTVTADPPGLLSIHYNPAGLSHLPEGAFFSFGLTFPHIQKTSRFRSDPEFEGFLGGFKDDPLAGIEGTNSSARMFIPFYNGTVDFQVSPSFGISHRKAGSKWTFACGTYAPYGVGLVHGDEGDPARFGGKSMYQQHFIYAAPSASYQATRTLSFGVSVGLGMTVMGAELDIRAPNDMVGIVKVLAEATEELEIPVLSELTFPPPWFGGGVGLYDQVASIDFCLRDNFSPSFNIGLLWEPRKWFAFGAVYQSPIKVHLTGNYKFTYSAQWQQMMNWFGTTISTVPIATIFNLPTKGIPSQSGIMTAEMEFPQRVQFGIKVKPFKRLSLLADLHWANWSVLEEDRLEFDQDIQALQLTKMLGYTGGERTVIMKRDFKDTLHWSVGMELELLRWLVLRAGYEWRPTSVRPELYDLTYALPDLHNIGLGLGFNLQTGLIIDLGFAYIFNHSFEVPNNSSTNLNSTSFMYPIYNPYAGLDYEQETVNYLFSLKVSSPPMVLVNMTKQAFKSIGSLFKKK